MRVVGSEILSLPTTAPFDSKAEAPQPVGLVGANRSRRLGDGSEFAGIRGFHPGDRLRRINWRVSLRTGDLHVVTARSEEDSGVLIVVDGLADHGRSGGIGGEASSLDTTVRSAAALAEHFTRTGDRVSLRIVGGASEVVGYGAGARHLRRLQTTLARLQPGQPRDYSVDRLQFRATGGTVVLVLSPMLDEAVVTATAKLVRLGLPVMVIDTLPPDAPPAAEGSDSRAAGLAWRMRLTDRDGLLAQLARTGCPIVPWQGPAHARPGAASARPTRPGAADGGPMTWLRTWLRTWLLTWLRTQLHTWPRSQRILRAVIAVGPALALVASLPAGADLWLTLFLLVFVLSVGNALVTDSVMGLVAMLIVMSWWATGVPDPLSAWVLAAAAALVVTQVASVLADYGPPSLDLDPDLLRLWLRRAGIVFPVAPAAWLVARLADGAPDEPGIWVAGLAALSGRGGACDSRPSAS